MNKIKIVCVLCFLVFGVSAFLSGAFLQKVESRANGPQAGRTGAPGETTCTGCHAVNAGPGTLTIGAPTNYVPGQTYLIQVQHATIDTTRLRWGFELTALDGSDLAAGTFSLNPTPTPQAQTISGTVGGNTRFYAEQILAGTFAGTSGGATWTFNWIAPATNVGPVTFYAAGIQADNSNSNSGDQTYTTTAVSVGASPTDTATATPTPTSTFTPTNTPTPADCTTTMYAADTTSHYFTVNINTGAGTLVGMLPFESSTEIEYDPMSGRAFSQAGGAGSNPFGNEFDVTTGAAIGGQINNGHTFTGLEWVGTTLYGTSIEGPSGPATLRTLDPWTGVSTAIGDTGTGPMGGLAYDQNTGTMYGITGSGGNLYTINLSTGAATLIGPTGINAGSLEFGHDGLLYAGGSLGSAGNLYRMNTSTGAATLVGATGFGPVSGLMNFCVLTPTPTSTPTNTPTNTVTNTPTPTPTSSSTPSISGVVSYANAAAPPKFISGVDICAMASVTICTTTNSLGQYTLTGFGSGTVTVTASKTNQVNGISSGDAARIAQHVAGISLLTTNVQKISADVSNNGALSSTDAAKIAQYVAGITPLPVPNVSATWRFFLPGVTFPIGTSPQSYSLSPPTGPVTNIDFSGILGGDVTGNWNPAGPRPAGEQVPGSIAVELPNITPQTDKVIVVPVRVNGAADKEIISYEFDLRYDPSVIQPAIEPVDVKDTASRGLSYVANVLEPGVLRVVTYGAMSIDGNDVLLNLQFTAVGTTGAASPLTFERIMFNEGEPNVAISGGQIELL